MYRQPEKMLNSNIFSTCSHNMSNFSPLTAEICSGVWGTPANFSGFLVLSSLLQRRRSPEANQTCTMFGHFMGWYTIYTFSGALAPWRNFARWEIHFTSKSCVFLYWQRYCTAHQERASAKLRRGTRNGITEISQRAPRIFGWAAITLGIGPYSSLIFFFLMFFLYQ